uniref:SLC12 domain-containing protein n=1 Tax=Gongylonema pulchrum TaxID=637853 RepID=A0A183EJV8_9BILA
LAQQIKLNKIRGFCDVLMTNDVNEGICCLIQKKSQFSVETGMIYMLQMSGLASLRHNTVVVAWPDEWAETHNLNVCQRFVSTLRAADAARCAMLVPKNLKAFPSSQERVHGHVDVWWIVHDGGMLMLLPFLLMQTKTWRNTRLRLFTIAHMDDNTPESDISEYTYERTMRMEERVKLLKDMQASEKKVDAVVEAARERKLSRISEEDPSSHARNEKSPEPAETIPEESELTSETSMENVSNFLTSVIVQA